MYLDLQEVRSYCYNAICIWLVTCSKCRPDDDDDDDDGDPTGPKHVAVLILYKGVPNGYRFTAYVNVCSYNESQQDALFLRFN